MTGIRFISQVGRMGILAAALGLLAGCAASQQEMTARARLNAAQATLSRAQAKPEVNSYAPVQLQEARRTLLEAEQAEDWERRAHLSYVAQKRAQIAEAEAERKSAEVRMEDMSRKTSQILMQKREQELRQAQMELDRASSLARQRAEEAQRANLLARQRAEEAERARRMAEGRGQDLEKARMESEASSREAEQARMEADAKSREAEQRLAELQQARQQALGESQRAERARMEAQQLQKELSDLKTRQTQEGLVVTLGDVLFGLDQATLKTGAERSLSRLADFLKRHPERRVLIEGFTDSTGSKDYNLELSRRRAESVKDHLVSLGVNGDRISTKGYGERYPVASNDNPGGRQLNRRVEVTVVQDGVQPQAGLRR